MENRARRPGTIDASGHVEASIAAGAAKFWGTKDRRTDKRRLQANCGPLFGADRHQKRGLPAGGELSGL